MFSKVKTLISLPVQRKRLLIEAFYSLVKASLKLRFQTLKSTTSTLGSPRGVDHVTFDKSQLQTALDIGHTVEMIAKNLPWTTLCLPQAIAVKWMAQRRGIDCTLYFGTEGQRRDDGSLEAHAWVAIDNRIIIGGAESKQHSAISAFA